MTPEVARNDAALAHRAEQAERATPDLTTDELRLLVDRHRAGIRAHVEGLKHELTTLSDVTVAGRPVLDHVRRRPFEIAGAALGVGLVTGLVTGVFARFRERRAADDQTLLLNSYLHYVVDDAGRRAVDTDDVDDALRRAMRARAPVITLRSSQVEQRGAVRDTVDKAVNTALGFAVKTAMDMLTKRLTGREETFAAVDEATDKGPTPPGAK